MAVKSGFQLVLFLHLLRFGFVDSKTECVFSGNALVPFSKDAINGQRPCHYTLLGTNNQNYIDSFRIDVICDKITKEQSVVVTALRKKIQLNASNFTVDQIPQERDVSILIPPLRIDVIQNGAIKKLSLSTGISVTYIPQGSSKVIVFDNYTGTHNLSGACGDPWSAGRRNLRANRRRLFTYVNDKPNHPKYGTHHSANGKPSFNTVSQNGHPKNRHNFPNQQNGARHHQTNPNNSFDDRNRFQGGNFYPNCYSGGSWRTNGSVWMSVDCSMIFACKNSFVTHTKIRGCSEFAECVKVRQVGTCRCKPGYIGNGLICVFPQDKITSNYHPDNNFAALMTPISSANRPFVTVAYNLRPNIKGNPMYSDWRNQGLMPSFNDPWGRRNQNDFPKKNGNKTWRPSKTRPHINTHKPRRGELEKPTQPGSFQLNFPPNFPDVRRNPNLNKLLDLLSIGDRKRPLTKTAPNSQHPRTQPGTMRSGQNPKLFGRPNDHFNKNGMGSQPGDNPNKDLLKPLKGDRTHLTDNRGHPGTRDKNTIPRNNTFRVYPMAYPAVGKPHQRYISCRKDNKRMLCKLIKDPPKNGKMVPILDSSNPNPVLGKGRMDPLNNIPNNLIPYKTNEPRTNAADSPHNVDNLFRNFVKDILNPENHRNPNKHPTPEFPLRKGTRMHPPNNEDPLSRTLTNPKGTYPGSNQPNLIDTQNHKPPYLNRRGHKQPGRSDFKQTTEIPQRGPGALNKPIKKSDTTGEWTVVPVYNTQFTPTNKFPTPTIDGNLVSKKVGDNRFHYPSSTPPGYQHLGRKGDNFIPSVKNHPRKKAPQDNSIINKHRYPTADGTIDGFLVEPPAKWPLERTDIKPHGNYNIPTIKHVLPKFGNKYPNKESNKKKPNRHLKNRNKPTSKIDSLIKRCKLNGSGCMKIKNATRKHRTLLPRKNQDLFPITSSMNLRNNRATTTASYSTTKTMTTTIEPNFIKDGDKENWKPHQLITNTEKKHKILHGNVEPPSSVGDQPIDNEGKREKCDGVTSGLRYKIMKKVKHSVEQIEG